MKTILITCFVALLLASDAVANVVYSRRGAGRREFILPPSVQPKLPQGKIM